MFTWDAARVYSLERTILEERLPPAALISAGPARLIEQMLLAHTWRET
jgi:hypothetical protein